METAVGKMTNDSMGLMQELSDDLIMDMVHLGEAPAITEAKRRGLDIPEPADTSADAIPEYFVFDDSEIDPDTPREQLPMGLLIEAIAEGDTEAARVLHARYPYLYDEAGKLIEYDTPLD